MANCIEWHKHDESWVSNNYTFQIREKNGVFEVYDIRITNNEKTVALNVETFAHAVAIAQGYWLEQA